jgi:hypothetical protein
MGPKISSTSGGEMQRMANVRLIGASLNPDANELIAYYMFKSNK